MVVITHRHVLPIENEMSDLISKSYSREIYCLCLTYKCDRERKLIVTANRKYKGKNKNERYILRVC